MKHPLSTNRRNFIKTLGAGIAMPLFIPNLFSAPPSRRIRHASFGADNMAASDWTKFAALPDVDIVCIAEVDSTRLDKVKEKFPDGKVKIYQDWREMLDKEHKNLDTVNVSTPDHMHAPQGMSAMQLGLHAYIQKPLAHDIYEVRRLTEYAKERKLVTQMGIQVHSSANYRNGVALIRSGAIGKVKEVHTWSNKKWGNAESPENREDPVPSTLNWDLWLGVCKARPFIKDYYHPRDWRKLIDFGTGTFGDMGCHIYDPVFESLGLTAPISVRSEGEAPSAYGWATNALIRYVFPGTKYTSGKTVSVTWYDGTRLPPEEVLAYLGDEEMPGEGSIFLGTKGVMVLPHSEQRKPTGEGNKTTSRPLRGPILLPADNFKDYPMPKLETVSHWKQFIDAVRGEGKTSAPLSYAGPLTEAVLLGSVATFLPQTTLKWNAAKLKFDNSAEAGKHLRHAYRKGWEVKGLS